MDRERLAKLLEEPGKVAREDLADLKDLAERFPWFSGAHLLRAVGEQAGGDVLSEEAVRACAAHIPSRAVLFDLKDATLAEAAAGLKHKSTPPAPEPPKPLPIPEAISEAQVVQEQEEIETAGDPLNGTGDLQITEAAEAEVDVTEEPASEIPILAETTEEPSTAIPVLEEPVAEAPPALETNEQEPAEDEPRTEAGSAVEELENQIIEAALASAYDLTWQERLAPLSPGQKEESRNDTVSSPGKRTEEPVAAASGATSTGQLSSGNTGEGTGQRPKSVSPGSRLKFTDWLSATESPAPPAPRTILVPPVPVIKEEAVVPPPAPKKIIPAVDAGTLIDRFIQQETPPPVRKAEFFTPQQAAKRSLDDSAGLVSETLARVYEKQGNFQKAMDAYRKLALKYPEKSAYFAALSKELEGKMNS
jgi:hypothetical protein